MTTAAPTADLAARAADPGFTPGVRLLPALLDLLAGEETQAKNAERAILRIEPQYAARTTKETVERARAAERPARGRLTRLVARLAQEKRDPEGAARAWLIEALGDADPKTRHAAARGLGNLERTADVEAALAHAFDRTGEDAFALALGKLGGEAARTRLVRPDRAAGPAGGRARLIAEREHARSDGGAIDTARAHERPLRLWFHARSGLEGIVEDELREAFDRPCFAAPGVVEAHLLSGPLAQALAVRTATHVGIPLPARSKGTDLAADVVAALASEEALAVLRAFTTRAPIRFRVQFLRGGHRRAVAWRIAELVRGRVPELINDPRSSPWEVVVDDAGNQLRIELVPRGYEDTRFVYRQDLVPASSHPTIAAALARVAPRRADDVVWDPFAGAAAELIERARLGPYARLIGTDTDTKAVAAARANLARAGIPAERASVEKGDALLVAPSGVTLIVTNPPMGRRVQRGTHADLLERFVEHAARVLVPGGALVWLVPEPKRVRARAAKAGLAVSRAITVDMSGFSAELGVYVKKR